MAKWQPVRVTVMMDDSELDEAGVFNAYTDGEIWNGWLVPYFTAAEGQRVADWTTRVARSSVDPESQDMVRWDEQLKAFVIENSLYPDEPEMVTGQHVDELGQIMYGIGVYRWTWETA